MTNPGYLGKQPSAVDNAFVVLEAVVKLGPEASAAALMSQIPLSRATVYRILKHLVENGYLEKSLRMPGFSLGSRVKKLCHDADQPATPEPSPEASR